MGIDIWKEAKKKAQKAIDSIINPAIEAGKKAVYDGSKWARWKVSEAKDEAIKGVRNAGKEVEDNLTEKLPAMVEDVIVDKLPELLTKEAPRLAIHLAKEGLDEAEKIAGELQRAISKPGLKAAKGLLQGTYDGMSKVHDEAPQLVEYLDKPGFGSKVGPVKLCWTGFYTRAETLLGIFDRWIDKPPAFSRRDIREFLTSFGPDEVEFDVDVKANVVVVGSTVMEVGGNVPAIPFPLAVFCLDKILEAAGVPE